MLVRLSSRGWLVIPRSIRETLRLSTSTRSDVQAHEGKIILEAVAEPAVGALCGKYGDADVLTGLEEEHQREVTNEEDSLGSGGNQVNRKPLQDKVAIVTGGANGIGLAIAQRLAADGASVIIGDMQGDDGRAAAQAIGGFFVEGDLSRQADCRALVEQAMEAHGGVNILVNNAGFQSIHALEEFPEEVWSRMMAVMLTAPFLLTKYVWPSMMARKWGRVVNIASIHGLVASPNKAGYVTAKHGLVGLTRAAALEGGPHGITVNAICPAYVRTPLVQNQISAQARVRGLSEDEVVEKVMLEPAAIKRLIEPEEVAGVAAFLCTDEAGAITGTTMQIDLGWTAR